MSTGVFSSLSSSYLNAAKSAFFFVGQSPVIFKPFTIAIAALYSLALVPIGIVFGFFIILDWIGGLVDLVRKFFINFMDRQSWSIDNSFVSFLFRPLLLVLIAPLFLFSIFIPKLSSSTSAGMEFDGAPDAVHGKGAFKKVNEIVWRATSRLLIYVSNAPLFLKPFVAVVAIVYSIVLLVIGLLFTLFIPLDWISGLVEVLRKGIVNFVYSQQQKIRYGGVSFLFSPIVLILLSPLFLAIILIPKFTTSLDIEV